MYKLALQGDTRISLNAFSALGTAIDKVSNEILTTVFSAIVDLLDKAIEEGSDSYFVEQICFLLQKLFFRLKGQIDEFVEKCWNLLSTAYGMDEAISYSFILPIAALGRASTPELFQPFFEQTIQFVISGLTEPNSQAAANSALSLSLLSDAYDLTPIIGDIVPPMIGVLQNEEIEDVSKKYVVDVVKDLAEKIPEPFNEALADIMPPIFFIADQLADYQEEISDNQKDEDLYESFESLLVSYLECFKATIALAIQAGNPIVEGILEATIDLLEIACGLDYHKEPLLREIVLVIGYLMEKFPDQMREFMDNEPGFFECLKMAVKGAIEVETLTAISTFLQVNLGEGDEEEEAAE
jgi:hypothetical protein